MEWVSGTRVAYAPTRQQPPSCSPCPPAASSSSLRRHFSGPDQNEVDVSVSKVWVLDGQLELQHLSGVLSLRLAGCLQQRALAGVLELYGCSLCVECTMKVTPKR